ncbi:MAG: ThuA domain-containing protein [Pirellulales bacterium]|nr:ThuA domain-containing protein [Pirellulales bacterium]
MRGMILAAAFWMSLVSASFAPAAQQPAAGSQPAAQPRLVFLVTDDPDNYQAVKTIPPLAKALDQEFGFRSTVIQGEGPLEAMRFPGLETLKDADGLVVFCRRCALTPEQLELIRAHLAAGKPVIGIRTANHAFSVRGKPAEGHEAWWEFVPEVLGCENHGYGPEKAGVDVTVADGAQANPVLKGVEPAAWHGHGSLYLVKPIDREATVLLNGEAKGKTEPVAWTRLAGKSRVFYTSLGHPDDFKTPAFRVLLVNGIHWALGRDVPNSRTISKPR